jgi:protocatechuate 3,4-dioxygenase beta subunit
MKIARRRILRDTGALGVLASVTPAWPQAAAGCAPASSCRKDCGPTGSATEGPFYVGNAPEGVDINPAKAPGQAMRIAGTVYGEDGVTPVRRARVEIWHADPGGDYHPNGNGDITRYRRGEINLRGVTYTDDSGRYAFTSIVPGHYGDRRRHIHWKVSAPGHRALTTQSYWLDERGTERERHDSTDRRVEACRWVDFRQEQGSAVGVFDIVLKTSA